MKKFIKDSPCLPQINDLMIFFLIIAVPSCKIGSHTKVVNLGNYSRLSIFNKWIFF